MTVIVSDSNNSSYDGNLSTTNGFYRAEAYNMAMFSATDLALTSTRTISMTFANSGNLQGIVLALVPQTTTFVNPVLCDKSVVVTLYEGAVARATVTYTASQIHSGASIQETNGGYIVPFMGGTFPYAVTTAAATWSVQISQTGGTTGNWALRTSNGTAPFYVAWCNNKVTFANNDTPVIVSSMTINQTATFRAVGLGTGDSARSICGVICRNTDLTPANVSLLKWQNPASASYTLTLDGLLIISAHGGFRVGTSASPIAYANKADIFNKYTPTYGSAANSGISCPEHSVNAFVVSHKCNLFLYGEIPTVERTTLSTKASIGATSITTTDTTGWVNGDTILIGKCDALYTGWTTLPTITVSSSSGTTVNISATATYDRLAGAMVTRINGYGVVLRSDHTYAMTLYLMGLSNFKLSGVQITNIVIAQNASNVITALEDAAYRTKHEVSHCSYVCTPSSANTASLFSLTVAPEDGMTIEYVNAFGNLTGAMYESIIPNRGASGAMTITENRIQYSRASQTASVSVLTNPVITNNWWDGGSNGSAVQLSAANVTFTGNRFWSHTPNSNSSQAGLEIRSVIGEGTWSGNYYDSSARAVCFSNYYHNTIMKNDLFGTLKANTNDVYFYPGAITDIEIQSPTGNIVVDTTDLPYTVDGTLLRVSDYNDVPKDDRCWTKYGLYQRCGPSLSDTTVRTADGYSLRMKPTSSTSTLEYPLPGIKRIIPTGNIQGQSMSVTAWVKINSANYWAGTHQMPRLYLKYDDATTTYQETTQTTDWQSLTITFTPTTTFEKFDVWFSGKTDATNTNAYFYIDDFSVVYPTGHELDAGTLDVWNGGQPMTPPLLLAGGTTGGNVFIMSE